MSSELIVYSRQPDFCDIARLVARVQGAGWQARVLNGYTRSAELLEDGLLPGEGVIFGWDPAGRKAERLAALFPPRRIIDAWALSEGEPALAGCTISASRLETPDDQFELDQWLGDNKLAPEKLAVLQHAECRYEISNWITEDAPLSERFLLILAWALAKETGGIVFNPEAMRAFWAEEIELNMLNHRL